MEASGRIVRLCEIEVGETGDCFALLVAKDRSKTRDGKPYYRVTFRDSGRSVTAMVWADSAWFADCESAWRPGDFYKLRCRYIENHYGPQVEIEKIRPTEEGDTADGFDPFAFYLASRFDPATMHAELIDIAATQISDPPLRELVIGLLEDDAEALQRMPAAARNHHAFAGGFLEHVLSVTRTAVYLADRYREQYPDMQPPLSKSLVVAGAILHDIGKLVELRPTPHGADHTAAGRLIGHIVLGRDLVREKAADIPEMDPEILLRLEHIIIAHQNLPEWGSPIAPHTPEALLVHYADDIDAKFQMMAAALEEEPEDGTEFTSRGNPLRRAIFRGLSS